MNELAKHNYRGQEKIAPWLAKKEEPQPEYVPARIRADWKMPNPKTGLTCPECGEKIFPIAHNTGDGWFLGWECSAGTCDPLLFEDGMPPDVWPFTENFANWRDLEAVGFTIV